MKITNKIIAAMAALLVMSASVYAAALDDEEEAEETPVASSGMSFSFSNTLASDIIHVNIINDNDDDNKIGAHEGVEFAGVTEGVDFEFKSAKVDAGVKLTFAFAKDRTKDDFCFKWLSKNNTVFDYYVEFRPFSFLTLGYHDNAYMYGSYLPVYGRNLEAGNLGSKGFTAFVRPIAGLRIAVSIPFDVIQNNYFTDPFTFGAGVDYTYNDFFSVGIEVQDIIDGNGITIAGYGLLRPTKARDLTIRAGFEHTQRPDGMPVEEIDYRGYATMNGQNMYNASITYLPGDISLMAEVLGNINIEQSMYDMYIGALFGYKFSDTFAFELKEKLFFDFDTNTDALFDVFPNFIINVKKHQFTVGVDLEFCGANILMGFPVSWTYTL